MNYQEQAAQALQASFPELWQSMQMEQLEHNPMLLGLWQFHLRQAVRRGLEPHMAAIGFIQATRPNRVH
jgi:hypothetical protein